MAAIVQEMAVLRRALSAAPRALLQRGGASRFTAVPSVSVAPRRHAWQGPWRWHACALSTTAPEPRYRVSARARCEDKDWTQLSAEQQAAAEGLGWTPESWDGEVEHGTDQWEDLTKEERAWAIQLGFTRKIWDTPFLGVFWDELDEDKQVWARAP